MYLKNITYPHSKCGEFNYPHPENVVNSLNNGTYIVIKEPIKIYELW